MSVCFRSKPLCRLAAAAAIATIALTPVLASAEDTRLAAVEPERTTGTQTLTFGIVPQQSASRLAKMWGPLLARLSDDLGIQVRFETTKDIPTFEACLAVSAYDLAYMNPVHYTIFAEVTGYRAVARQTDKQLHGLLVVRKDSDINELSDLNGAEIAFPSPGAFGASVVPRAEMRAQGISFTPNYVKSHDSVYRAVAAGLMSAGGGVLRTFNAIDPALRDQLRVIYRTEGYTPHALASLPGVSEEIRASIQDSLMDITVNAPQLAKSVGMNGFETARDQDWDDVRALDLGTHETGISTEGAIECPSG